MQRRNILRLLAGPLEAVKHICRPARMQRRNILRLLAGPLEAVNIYVAGTHAVQEYYIAVGWIAQSGKAYMSLYAYSAHDIPGPICYMRLKHISWPRLAGMLYAPL